MNVGKEFESQFRKSVIDDGFYYHRLNDPAQSFSQSSSDLRFSPQNPYDCYIFTKGSLFTLELKSTQGSLTFYREDFLVKGKKQTFNVKKNQIEGLQYASKFDGIVSGLILNFRKYNKTYFLHIDDFMDMINSSDKKSFNEQDVVNNKGLLIGQSLKRVKYKYDIKKFVEELRFTYVQNNVD